ncbi:MAG: FAD-dependent oxidoreductase [Acetatifactor sp.]|nr:FAD-dependent oxidoreductase [Acetatifactor sp.]
MLQINQLKINSAEVHAAKALGTEGLRALLRTRVAKLLRVSENEIGRLDIRRESIDARKKPNIFYIYTVEVYPKKQDSILRKLQSRQGTHLKKQGFNEGSITVGGVQIAMAEPVEYCFPQYGTKKLQHPIVIVGTGPAGLFCGYFLALHGYRPILLERGKCVEERQADVERFWETGRLDIASNVQFGEGGAGTFSDGKLNTLVKDKDGRGLAVLQVFVECGAKDEILYEAKPHLGTDVLCGVVRCMRNKIIAWGGEVRFESQMTDVDIRDGKVCGVEVNHDQYLPCDRLVLATGHSARDTFETLCHRQIPMEAKSFAVGLRVEHPQALINQSQFGAADGGGLGAATYKVTAKADNGRGVYSFCMCPGGYVVNASSEEGRLAVNGMSYSGRKGQNANSAIIVSVTPEDYGSEHPLAGVEFQRRLEERAFSLAGGRIPMQRYGVFKVCVEQGKAQEELERSVEVDTGMFLEDNADCEIVPGHKGESAWADVSQILPKACNQAFVQGMESFGRQIRGFDREDVILSGVESRTSSPLRIPRDETLQSMVRGIYPCGEGAGYAGGITSAAMDGLRVAEQLASEFASKGVQK